MGLFKKKENKTQYVNKTVSGTTITAYDRMSYKTISTNSDELLFDVCDTMLSGHPVLVKFEKIDNESANKMLAFISGVLYATDGKIFKAEPRLFLIGRKEEFEDGSLYQYIEDLKC